MGQQCVSQAKGCICGQMDKGAEAGQSLLSKVNDKFTDKMEEVIDTKLMTKCDDLFDKSINKLVDVTIDKALSSAIKLADKDAPEEEETPKTLPAKSELRKASAIKKLKDWGISQMLITTMEQDGWLDERIWNELNKEQLQMLGFADGHMALFLRGMEKLNLRKDFAVKLLREWKIAQTLIDNMEDEHYLDVDKWKELKDDSSKLKAMGFCSDDIQTFLQEFDKIDDEDEEDVNEFGIVEYIRYEEVLKALLDETLMDKVQQKIAKYWTDIKSEDFNLHPKNTRNENKKLYMILERKDGGDENKYPDPDEEDEDETEENNPFTEEEEKQFSDAQKLMEALQKQHMLDRNIWPTITREKLKRLHLNIEKHVMDNILWVISRKILHLWGLSHEYTDHMRADYDRSKKQYSWIFVDKWDRINMDDTVKDHIDRIINQRAIRKKIDLVQQLQNEADIFRTQLQSMRVRKQRMKEKEQEAEIILKNWKMSEKAIHVLRSKGLLKKSKWKNIDAKDLKGLPQDDLNIFLKGKDRKDSDATQYADSEDPTLILKEWGLPSDLINKLKEEGWAHPEYWGDLLDHEYYDLLDLGFRPGHISTFKRQYQRWKEAQDQLTKERKIQLLRKLDTKANKESSILKRNIDVQNDTSELIRVRIIGERKYDSFKSSSGAQAQNASKASARSSDKSSNVSMKSSKTNDTDSSKTSDKTLDVNVGVSGVPVGGAVSVGGSVGVNKTESTTQNTKTHATQDNQRDSANKAAEARRNQSATASNTSKAAASQHQWQKVNVGFAEIMPKQTITFPVQISDPNAVVYMTIMVPSTEEKICDNVQIDANFIRVEQVKLEGAVTKIKWQPSVKAPKNPYSRSIVYAKQGIITAEGLCDYMRAGKQPVDEWIVSAIQQKLGDSVYDIRDKDGDMKALQRHVRNAVSIAFRLNKYDISGQNADAYREIEKDCNKADTEDEDANRDDSKVADLGTYCIQVQDDKTRQYNDLQSDEWGHTVGYDYTRDKAKTEWIAFIVKFEDKNNDKEDREQCQSYNAFEFVFIHSDQNWYKIAQRKKEVKKGNRIEEKEVNKPFEIREWNFWSLETYEIGNLVVQSEANPNLFQYFQLVKVKGTTDTYKISTIKDGETLYLKYVDGCLAAPTPIAKQADKFKLKLEFHYQYKKENANAAMVPMYMPVMPPVKANEDEDNKDNEDEDNKDEDNKDKKDNKEQDTSENAQLMRLIEMYIETNTSIKTYKHATDAKEDDISDQVIAIASKIKEGVPNEVIEVLQRIYEHKLENRDKNDGLLDTNKLCTFVKQFNFVSAKKIKFIHDSLDNAKFDIYGKDLKAKAAFIQTIKRALKQYDELWGEFKDKEDDKTITTDILQMVEGYKLIVRDIQEVHEDHRAHAKKCWTVEKYADHDSDDEEIRSVNKFFDVDGYNILKKWKLEQFYERMVDEGWENPLDWIHLDDWVLKQNLGFRPGHIRIFNRKYDLWVKKYNDVRRTIPAKRKGKDGVLIVAPNSYKMLEPNHKYEFTKVIVRKNAILTTKSWSPSKQDGGILLIRSYQEIVLEEGARIDVTGKGYWGSASNMEKGWGPPQTSGGGSVGWFECGAGGGGHANKGGRGYTPARFRCLHHQYNFETGKSLLREDSDDENQEDDDETSNKTAIEKDRDIYHGEKGNAYGDKELSVLQGIDYDKDFDDRADALPEAIDRHKWSLGSGGGYHAEEDDTKKAYRGGNGGGAIVLICNKLLMYDRSAIVANGVFACNDKEHETRSLCAGGAGGSIYLKVDNFIGTYTKKQVADATNGIFMALQARGGGEDDRRLVNSLLLRGIPVGIGSCGRIRVDYHSPSAIRSDNVSPYAYIAEGTERGEDQQFDTAQFVKSLKEGRIEQLKVENGAKYSYLIQSAKTDEVLIAADPSKTTDIFRYYKEWDLSDIGIVCEPWFLYGDQSWTFIQDEDIGVHARKKKDLEKDIEELKEELKQQEEALKYMKEHPDLQPNQEQLQASLNYQIENQKSELKQRNDDLKALDQMEDEVTDERETKEIDLWDGVRMRMQKMPGDDAKEDDYPWFCLQLGVLKNLNLWSSKKFGRPRCDEALLRFITVGNKWLIVIMDKDEDDEKKKKSSSNAEQLKEKLERLKNKAYTLKLVCEKRKLVKPRNKNLRKLRGKLAEYDLCSKIVCEPFSETHLTDESCLFYVHRYVAEKAALISATKSQKTADERSRAGSMASGGRGLGAFMGASLGGQAPMAPFRKKDKEVNFSQDPNITDIEEEEAANGTYTD